LTNSFSGHLVAFIRLRNSVSSASGTFTLNGRISKLLLSDAALAPVALVVFVALAPVALVVFVGVAPCANAPLILKNVRNPECT
jgi:NAD/NADP transhydrogenase beta subunit